jgi:hypothetical protein
MKYQVNVDKVLSNKKKPTPKSTPIKKMSTETVLETYGVDTEEIKGYMDFQNDAFNMFYDDNDITMEQMISFINGCYKYGYIDNVMEATGRKPTRKVEKGLRGINDKLNGKKNTMKKNLRRMDDKASEVANRKLDDIINYGRELKREKLIEGRPQIKIGRFIKSSILAVAGATGTAALFGPAVAAIIVAIGLMCRKNLLDKTEKREKEKILLDLETDLKLTREKIEDAKAENDRKKKYQLMRIEATLQKEITRIKYNLRY